jgi:hypothetical protein
MAGVGGRDRGCWQGDVRENSKGETQAAAMKSLRNDGGMRAEAEHMR